MHSNTWETFGLHIPEILVPAGTCDYQKWAVVACDQYTSEPEYWKEVEEIVGSAPSALRMMLPELYLEKPGEAERIAAIRETMQRYLSDGTLRSLGRGCMLVRRTAEGRSRMGLVIATDFDQYDFSADSTSLTRATEGTVVERIPPRLRIREGAPLEMPHILILIDDPEKTVIEPLANAPGTPIYDTELMMNGGHISGTFINEEDLEPMRSALSALYASACEQYGKDRVIFQAMGDGNHSLATAKTAWEAIKASLTPEEAAVHPARYALCEIENIHDPGIVFEPIHRAIFAKAGQSGSELLEEVAAILRAQNGSTQLIPDGSYDPVIHTPAPSCDGVSSCFDIPYRIAGDAGHLIIHQAHGKLAVGVLQNAIDVLVKEQGRADVDYIHGEHALARIAARPGAAGFLLPSMDKSELFPAIASDGALPRKTFSMGEANEKRYYIECRSLI